MGIQTASARTLGSLLPSVALSPTGAVHPEHMSPVDAV
jgi:hypothetical protein